MSYSFQVRASSKADAMDQITARLNEVVEVQPAHMADASAARRAAATFIDLLQDNDPRGIIAAMNGAIVLGAAGGPTAVSIGISISRTNRDVVTPS